MIERDSEAAHLLANELVTGERILWQGKPRRRLRAHHIWIVLLSLILNGAILAFLIFSMQDFLGSDWFGSIFAYGVVAIIGGSTLLGAFRGPMEYWRARRSIFAVTDRRIIKLGTGRGRAVTSVDFWQIGPISRIELADGSGTLRIAAGSDEVPSTSEFFGTLLENEDKKQHIFEIPDLRDIRSAENAIRRMLEMHYAG